MQVDTKRDQISLEEALAFIKYLNRQKPFDKEEIIVPTHDIQEVKNKKPAQAPEERLKKMKQEEVSEDITKKINKNRAIKRIIESAFQILQNFNTYQEDLGAESEDKSSEIQLNIYLKQYNRVLERIEVLEKERLSLQSEQAEHREQVLQNIYEYTVVQDFREILPVATLKDKISKTNIEIMIQSLSKCLVVLKSNELRIYDSIESSSPFKTIKLHEIQNVDYHTQPYILMVLSIQKDKERFNVYMQFQSQKNQEKWDRALYCCYIGRKMKSKQKFFLIEYPEEDVKKKEKEQTKKQAAFYYQLEPKKKTPLDKILTEQNLTLLSEHSRDDIHQNQQMMSRSNTRGYKKQLSSVSKEEREDQIQKEDKISSQNHLFNKSNKYTNNDTDTNRLLDIEKRQKEKQDEMINRVKTDFIEISKPPRVDVSHTPLNKDAKDYNDRDNSRANIFGNFNKEDNRDEFDRQNELKFLKEEDSLPDDIIQIHNLQRKHVKGLILQKQKFFFNKAKKLYLRQGIKAQKEEDELQINKKINIQQEYQAMKWRQLMYLDFDSNSGEESNPKIIKLFNIKSYSMKDKTLSIVHDKEITFTCDGDSSSLKEVHRWIDLVQNVYKNKLITSLEGESGKAKSK